MSRTGYGLALAASALASTVLMPQISLAQEEHAESWRLFIADHTLPVVRAIDLASGKEIGRFDTKGFNALSLSESGRTLFAIQGDQNLVQAIDTGVALSDHGDHRDIELSDPKLLPTTITGKKPGHVVTHGDDIAVFYDRDNRFDLLSEEALIEGKPAIRGFETTLAHHGVAVPMGNYLLTSVPKTDVTVKEGELPPRRGLRVLDREGKQLGDIATCSDLHGEATSARLVAFGCTEGVLVVRPNGSEAPKLELIAYGDTLPKGKVSTLLGGTSMQFFLGNYGEDKVALIDPDDKDQPYRLVDLPTRRVDFALDPAEPRNAYVLTEDGKLHLIDTIDARITLSETVTEPYSKDGHWRDPRPRLAVAGDHIVITDPRHSLVRVIDPKTLKEERTIAVEGQPFVVVAAGGSGATH